MEYLVEVFFAVIKSRRFLQLLILFALAALGLGVACCRFGVGLEDLKSWWSALNAVLLAHPWWLFAALVVLPGFPVPSSALLVLAGTVWHDRPLVACGVVLLALAANLSWTYWVSSGPGRRLVERWVLSGRYDIPEFRLGNDLKLILLMRLFPGMPLFVQNYVLGFFRVRFRLYFLLSMLCTGTIACSIVLGTAGIANGNLIPIVIGALLLGAVVKVKAERLKR